MHFPGFPGEVATLPKDANKMIELLRNVSLYIIRMVCIKVTEVCSCLMDDIPDQYRTQKMYIKVVEKHPWQLYTVPDHF